MDEQTDERAFPDGSEIAPRRQASDGDAIQPGSALVEAVLRSSTLFLHVLRGPELVFEFANEAFYQLIGRRDLLGKPLTQLLPEAAAGGYPERIARVMETREPFWGRELPVRVIRTPGSLPEVRIIDLVYLPLVDADGACTRVLGHGMDVTEPVRARRRSEERLRLLVEGARDYAMFLLDPESRITYWSAGAERLFGWKEEEAVGQNGAIIFTREDRERGEPEREARTALSEGRAEDRRWHLRKDGTHFWADGLLMRLDEEGGGVRGFAKVTRDATAQKRAEERLREALEAVARANEELELRVAERTHELTRMSELRQELLRQLVTAQEQERRRISRDLHDDTAQQVAGLLLGLGRLVKLPALAADADAREILAQLEALANQVAEKSHRLAVTLRPTALDDLGLVVALTQYAREWSRWSDVAVEVEAIGMETRLPREIETTIYRIAQEALTNVLRHARSEDGERRATRVALLLQRRAGEVLAVIEDDGPGFDVEAALHLPPSERRLGIFGMQERARLAGGMLSIESSPGHGAAVCLRIPLPREGVLDA